MDSDVHSTKNSNKQTNKHRDSPTGIEITEDILFTRSLYRLSCYYLEQRLAFPLNLALPATL